MAKTTWGRKETIIWPRHMPIYTYGLAFAVVVLTFVAVCIRIHLATPLQRYYLPVYERTSAIGAFTATHRSTYRMLFVSGRGAAPRPAMNGDVYLGRTPEPDGKPIPLALSADAQPARILAALSWPAAQLCGCTAARLSESMSSTAELALSAFFRPPLLGGVGAISHPASVRSHARM